MKDLFTSLDARKYRVGDRIENTNSGEWMQVVRILDEYTVEVKRFAEAPWQDRYREVFKVNCHEV